MGSLGLPEIILIAVVALLFFGPKKLPELGSGLGKAIKGFRDAMKDTTSDTKPETPAPPKTEAQTEDQKQHH